MAAMEIRRFIESDAAAVWSLHRRALAEVGASGPEDGWEDDLRDIGRVYLADGEFLVGVAGSALVAMGALQRLSPTRAELRRMRVEPAFQGQGFGRRMLQALEAAARRLGVEELELETAQVQLAAQRLYESAGFRRTGEGHAHGHDTIRYFKSLRAAA